MTRKAVLIIAAHVPPYCVSSGYLRTLKFCEYLPDSGWDPIVLAPSISAFRDQDMDPDTANLLNCPVVRSFALDSSRHLAIRGRYPDILAVPDRWSTWWLPAVIAGMRLIRKHRPAVIFSTYPIATAHLIGLTLARITGIPWVADFRDPMFDDYYPPPGMARRAHAFIERKTIKYCAAAVFTSAGTFQDYRQRYPGASAEKMRLIMNGYDEGDFAGACANSATSRSPQKPLQLLHSGVLYPDMRDPTALFQALADLKREHVITTESLRVRLRASGHEETYGRAIVEYDIDDIVSIESAIPYSDALAEMCQVDGLLLLQGEEANQQVPAKLFEYFRAGTPILALLHPDGDTARLLRKAGAGRITRIDDASGIKAALRDFLTDAEERARWATPLTVAEAYSREASGRKLGAVLHDVTAHDADAA